MGNLIPIQPIFGDQNPFLLPLLLVALGLMCCLLVSIRWRQYPVRKRILVHVSYLVAAFVAIGAGGASFAQRSAFFWDVEWNPATKKLTLIRPLDSITVAPQDIKFMTEFTAPERVLGGVETSTQLIVQLRDGEEIWSAPLFSRPDIKNLRLKVRPAAPKNLAIFRVGPEQQP